METRIRLLGVEMDAVTRAQVMAFTAARVAEGRRGLVANHNLHSLALLGREPEMARFYALADLIEIDSMPLVAWGRLLGRKVGREHRNTYLDWREDFWRLAAEKGWRVFHLGCKPGVGVSAVDVLSARWPGVTFAERDGYFDLTGPENEAVLAQVAAFAPDILFVGMGMPRQEEWIAAHREALDRGVIFSVGAAFDYEAGVQAPAPRWTGPLGLEWLFRLVSQPRRLAHRYLVEPWALAPAAFSDLGRALFGRGARPAG